MTTAFRAQPWHDIWRGDIRDWIFTKGLHIVLLLIGAVLAARFVNWAAQKITQRLDVGFTESDALVRSEATKHRKAVAAVISWVSVVLIAVAVVVQITEVLQISVRGLVAPATVLGAALGFGTQQLVKDLLAGFSSSPKNNTGSAIWSSSPSWDRRRMPSAPWRTSHCG